MLFGFHETQFENHWTSINMSHSTSISVAMCDYCSVYHISFEDSSFFAVLTIKRMREKCYRLKKVGVGMCRQIGEGGNSSRLQTNAPLFLKSYSNVLMLG
jgi:hypothetical protein